MLWECARPYCLCPKSQCSKLKRDRCPNGSRNSSHGNLKRTSWERGPLPQALAGGEDVLRQSWERGITGCGESQPETGLEPEPQASSAHGVSAKALQRRGRAYGPEIQASPKAGQPALCTILGKTVQVTVEPQTRFLFVCLLFFFF